MIISHKIAGKIATESQESGVLKLFHLIWNIQVYILYKPIEHPSGPIFELEVKFLQGGQLFSE